MISLEIEQIYNFKNDVEYAKWKILEKSIKICYNRCSILHHQTKKRRKKETMRSKVIYELRVRGIDPEMPGHNMLMISIEATVQRGELTEKEIIKYLQKSKILIPKVRVVVNRTPEIQWMTEAIRSIGYNEDVITFVKEISAIVIKELIKDMARGAMQLANMVNLATI